MCWMWMQFVCTSELLNDSMYTVLREKNWEMCAILKWFSFVQCTLCAVMHPYDLPILIHTFHAHTITYTHGNHDTLEANSSGSFVMNVCRCLVRTIVRLFLPFPISLIFLHIPIRYWILHLIALMYISSRCSKRRKRRQQQQRNDTPNEKKMEEKENMQSYRICAKRIFAQNFKMRL